MHHASGVRKHLQFGGVGNPMTRSSLIDLAVREAMAKAQAMLISCCDGPGHCGLCQQNIYWLVLGLWPSLLVKDESSAVRTLADARSRCPIGSVPLPTHATLAMQEAGGAEMQRQAREGECWPSKVWRAMVEAELAELDRIYGPTGASEASRERSERTSLLSRHPITEDA